MLPSLISGKFSISLADLFARTLCSCLLAMKVFYSQQVFQRSQVETSPPTAHPVLLVLLQLLLLAGELPEPQSLVLVIFVKRVQALGVVVDRLDLLRVTHFALV